MAQVLRANCPFYPVSLAKRVFFFLEQKSQRGASQTYSSGGSSCLPRRRRGSPPSTSFHPGRPVPPAGSLTPRPQGSSASAFVSCPFLFWFFFLDFLIHFPLPPLKSGRLLDEGQFTCHDPRWSSRVQLLPGLQPASPVSCLVIGWWNEKSS